MGYALVVWSDEPEGEVSGSISIIDDLSSEDFNRYLEATEAVKDLMEGGLRSYAHETLNQYRFFVEQLHTEVARTGTVSGGIVYGSAWNRTGACAFLNFASAVHLFQEQTEALAARKGGDDAKSLVHQIFSDAYGGNVDYYLIYRLRNLLVHYSMRSIYLSLSSGRDESLYNHCMRLSRPVVLAARDGLSARLRAHIESMAEDPDVLPLMVSADAELQRVFHQAMPHTHPEAPDDLEAVCELDGLFADHPGARAIGEVPDQFEGERHELKLHAVLPTVFEFARGITPNG
jgi:hypothetical protein